MLSLSGLWRLLCLLNVADAVAAVLFLSVFCYRWFAIVAIVVFVSKPSSCILPGFWAHKNARRTISCRMLLASQLPCRHLQYSGSYSRYSLGWAHFHPFATSITSRERKNRHLHYIMVYQVCLIRRSQISKW